jgi:hypothetical protein
MKLKCNFHVSSPNKINFNMLVNKLFAFFKVDGRNETLKKFWTVRKMKIKQEKLNNMDEINKKKIRCQI